MDEIHTKMRLDKKLQLSSKWSVNSTIKTSQRSSIQDKNQNQREKLEQSTEPRKEPKATNRIFFSRYVATPLVKL